MADKAQDPALTQPQDSCAPRATLPPQHRSPPTQYSPENTCSIHPRAYTCNPTYVYTHVHTPAQPQPQPPSCYGDVSHGYGRLQGTGQPRNPQVPPLRKVPPGLPAAGSELRTPPRSLLPLACPGAGTGRPGSSGWCSRLGCGNRRRVSGGALGAPRPPLSCPPRTPLTC